MTSARCPACGAAVVSGAPWCTLCYADLRPKPAEPVAAPSAPATAAQAPAGGGRHRQAPRHATAATPSTPKLPATPVDLLDPALDRPVTTHAEAVRTRGTWPCHTCGHAVPLEEACCTQCGTSFLAGADPLASVKLPVVGDVRRLSTGARVALIAASAVGLMLVLLVVFAVIGQFV